MAATSDAKPWKPYQEFPLFAHQNGQWAKKIQGKQWFFGVWADPDVGLRKYLDEVAEIQAGRDPRRSGLVQVSLDQLTVYDFCNAFPERKLAGAKATEVSNRHFSAAHWGRSSVVTRRRGGAKKTGVRFAPFEALPLRVNFHSANDERRRRGVGCWRIRLG